MRIQRAIERRGGAGYVSCRAGCHYGRTGRAKRGEGLIAAHTRTRVVTGYDSEMINCVRTQAADGRANIQVRAPTMILRSGRETVACRGAILEVNSRGQPMWIEQAIECSGKTRDQRGRISYDDGRAGRAQRCKCPVAAKAGAATVVSYNSEMISSARGQAADVCSDSSNRRAGLSLHSCGGAIAGCEPILEIHSRGDATWIE